MGDNIVYSLDIAAAKGAEIELPDAETFLTDFYIKDKNLSETASGGKTIYKYRYILAAYETGARVIPAFEIGYRTNESPGQLYISVPEIRINVKSVLEKDLDKSRRLTIGGAMTGSAGARRPDDSRGRSFEVDSRTIYKIREAPPARDIKTPLDIIILASIALAAIIAGLLIIKSIMKFAAKKPLPPSPAESALESLKGLNKKGLYEGGRFREFYFELSYIIKEYVKRKFSLSQAEMTTGEFLQALSGVKELTEPQKKEISEFMRFADAVKFTGYAAAEAKTEFNVEFARRLIREIETKNALKKEENNP